MQKKCQNVTEHKQDYWYQGKDLNILTALKWSQIVFLSGILLNYEM